MSLSKERPTATAAADQPRLAKCARCRHHGIVVPQKGHMKQCPFLGCDCWKCYLVTQRTRITALQRNLRRAQSKAHSKEQRPRGPAGVSSSLSGPPASVSAPEGGARGSAPSELMRPRSAGAPGCPATAARCPVDPRSRPAAGGDHVAGSEIKEPLPFTSSETAPCSTFSAFYYDEVGQTPPLPAVHFPFRMSDHYTRPYPNFLFNTPWLPPVPAGFYNNSLCGPRAFPHFQQGAVHYPPPPEPGPPADCRQVFFTLQPPQLPEAFQEELMPRQYPHPPLPRHREPDTEELDNVL